MLRAINGSFPITARRKVFNERIFSKGYQSRRSNTAGRLTAIGLLRRARIKKQSVTRYHIPLSLWRRATISSPPFEGGVKGEREHVTYDRMLSR
jgi:hypothetical protein